LDDVLDELGVGAAGTAGELARRPWPPGTSRAARVVLGLLIDGGVVGPSRLADLTGLPAATAASAMVELELAGFVRRMPSGVQAVALPWDE
jgi:hypothetical protein